jgi:hypothetical protein
MKKQWLLTVLILSLSLSGTAALLPHIGYVYPAGANPGETLTVTVGGQYIEPFSGMHLSGCDGIEAEKLSYTYEVDPKGGGNIKNQKEKLEAMLSEETNALKKAQMEYQLGELNEKMEMEMMMRKEMRKDPALAKKKQFNPQIAERLQLKITIPQNAAPGMHELRLITTNGISNYLLFQVSNMREVAESEPNDMLQKPSVAGPLPAVLTGQIMPGDIDSFSFPARKGQVLVFRAQARALVPYLADAVPGWFQAVLTLYDAAGNEVAYDDDFYFDPDPVLIYTVPADGSYTLTINDSIYRGREDFVYRIEAGELPFINHIFPLGGPENSQVDVQLHGVNLPRTKLQFKTSGDAPDVQKINVKGVEFVSNTRLFAVDALPEIFEAGANDLLSQAQKISAPAVINGRMDAPGDFDCFRFDGRENQKVSIEVVARRLGSPLDARLVLLDAEEHIIASSDDVEDKSQGLETHHADACITTNLSATGIYTVRLEDLQGKGGDEYAYRLRIGSEQPDFCLRMTPASLRIPQDGSAVITVHAIRKGGFTGPIQLTLNDAPRGLTLDRAVIPERAEQAQVTISATDRSTREMIALEVEGTAAVGARTVVRRAVPAEDMMQAFIYRHWVPAEELLVMISEAEPVSVTVTLPRSGVVEARPGGQINLNAVLERQLDFKGNVQLELSEPPEWITLKTKNMGRPGSNPLIFDVSSNAEVGDTATLILNGKVRIIKPETDPAYNPVLKWMNSQTITMTIAAIPVKIVD